MFNPSKWHLWINRRGHVKGIAIVHQCSDYALELHTSLTEPNRREFLEDLCRKLNEDRTTARR